MASYFISSLCSAIVLESSVCANHYLAFRLLKDGITHFRVIKKDALTFAGYKLMSFVNRNARLILS